jgi:CxxC motif-containing protein (DUF1111 family)
MTISRKRNLGLFAGIAAMLVLAGSYRPVHGQRGAVSDAPTGLDGSTNGFISQPDFERSRALFEERDDIAKGLGPVYNAQSCVECHQGPVTGAASQVTVLRAGHFDGANFFAPPGGSLIHDRAIAPGLQERVPSGYEVRALRLSLSTLGDGYIEAIDDATILDLARNQPAGMRGEAVLVPVLEAPGTTRVGRFGWKAQHASLLSFSADAYLNEIGITNRLLLTENFSNGASVLAFDRVPDTPPNGEDVDNDIDAFARFMRATKPPSRDQNLSFAPDALIGASQFSTLGCSSCHVPDITTAPAGTVLNGGTFTVPNALGAKTIHPYSDFLLHDVGTGDGIVQNGPPTTRNKLRTPPLWGLRLRGRLMHDGASLTLQDAITRHGGEASGVIRFYNNLTDNQRQQVIAFLNSL